VEYKALGNTGLLVSKLCLGTMTFGGEGVYEKLKDNLAAIHLKLTRDESKSLDEVSQPPPEYPEWMLAIQGADRLGPVDLRSKSANQN
jgi:aryl-alcohol dehydrogenase-like predicted oxidoreductase